MGRDKALLPAGKNEENSFVGQLARNLAAFDDLWLSIGREESYPQISLPKISDRYPDAGPMGGLESALTVCRHDILFVTAVDMPFVDYDLAKDLYGRLMDRPDLDALLMVDAQGRKQHLLGLYRKRLLPLLRKRLEERQAALSWEPVLGKESPEQTGTRTKWMNECPEAGRGQTAGRTGAGMDQTHGRKSAGDKDRAYRMRDLLAEIRVAYVPADQVREGARKTLTCNTWQEYEDLLAREEAGQDPKFQPLSGEDGQDLKSQSRKGEESQLAEGLNLQDDSVQARSAGNKARSMGESDPVQADPAGKQVKFSGEPESTSSWAMTRSGPLPVISVTGWSGSGKTTFLEKLIPCLKERGLRLACLKHDAHHFQVDKEGKDSYRMTQAGTHMTGLFSVDKGVWMENRPLDLDQMLMAVHDVDLVLLEGGSQTIYPKILVYRQALRRGMRVRPEDCLAVVSDDPVPAARKQFSFGDPDRAADFIASWRQQTLKEIKDQGLVIQR